MANIKLVSAKAGLTNWYHQQVIRNQHVNIDSRIIDELSSENLAGGINRSTLVNAAVMSGGLNAVPDDWATIAGDFNTSKGLMMMTFVVEDGHVSMRYMSVIGYVTNNNSLEGLTASAIFHPAMSWQVDETITSSLDLANPTNINRKIGKRTDYMFSDGSSTAGITLRPSDVIDYALDSATRSDIMNRMEEEGLDTHVPQTTVAAADIGRVGVIPSKRQNQNPTMWSMDILKAGTNYQRNTSMASNMGVGETESEYDNMFGELSMLSHQANGTEPALMKDEFFSEMMMQMGKNSVRGFNGYTIGDLAFTFDNFEETLDLVVMNADQFEVADYTLNSESFGTSNMGEIVADEIKANILDLMLKYDLNAISLRGSNCDNFGDGSLDNIVILAYNPFPLKEDDYQLGQKVDSFIEGLRAQIFAKLNGISLNEMTPIRFDVTAELFGTCEINIQLVNDTNHSTGFSLDDNGQVDNMVRRSFPTFAINQTSAILGTSTTAQQIGAGFFQNLETYFQN